MNEYINVKLPSTLPVHHDRNMYEGCRTVLFGAILKSCSCLLFVRSVVGWELVSVGNFILLYGLANGN
jgi:hypothetical protein